MAKTKGGRSKNQVHKGGKTQEFIVPVDVLNPNSIRDWEFINPGRQRRGNVKGVSKSLPSRVEPVPRTNSRIGWGANGEGQRARDSGRS